MYSNQLSATAGVGSGLSRVIYSSDRQSNAEIEAGMTEMYFYHETNLSAVSEFP